MEMSFFLAISLIIILYKLKDDKTVMGFQGRLTLLMRRYSFGDTSVDE
jgi:hypothetical protein